jgi:hypothetical protein
MDLPMPDVAEMRTSFLAAAVSLAVAGCRPEDVSVVPPDPPPLPGSVAACRATPSPLTHLRGIVPQFLGADELNLYAVAGQVGAAPWSLWQVPKDGSSPQRLATSETPIVSVDLIDNYPVAAAALWATSETRDGGTGAVWSQGLGARDKPVLLASGRHSPTALTANNGEVYWAEQEVDTFGKPIEAIVEIAAAGEPIQRVQTLDAGQIPHNMVAYYSGLQDGSIVEGLIWTTFDPALGNESTAEIVESPLPFGPLARIAGPRTGGAGALAPTVVLGADVLYSGPTAIVSIVLADDGRPRLTPLLRTGGFVDRIRSDEVDVYFVDRATKRLVAATPPGTGAQSSPRTIVSSVDPAVGFVVDRACVYWVDADAETIAMRTSR